MTKPAWREQQQTVAVVVAHGIGNQLPMDTVRSMVDNVFGSASGLPDQVPVYSRLDRDADFLDLRRLMLTKTGKRPRVDFYELYWQPTFGSGSAGAVIGWAVKLLLRRGKIGEQIRQVVKTIWLVLLGLFVIAMLAAWGLWLIGPDEGWKQFIAPAVPLLAFALSLFKLLASSLLSNVVADASRWFSPGPNDIGARDKVRQQAVGLLRELHRTDSNGKPRYGRIIVVAHSLGAVVTYDAIRLAFDKLRDPAEQTPAPGGQLEQRQPNAWRFATDTPGKPPFLDADKEPLLELIGGQRYHDLQAELHAEQRSLGVPWRVTDFITVGSPLTHARDLMASKKVSLERRMAETEFPTCPPRGEVQHSEEERAKDGKPVPWAAGTEGSGRLAFYRADEEGPLRAHEASPFATTRWTNLYIPMKRWLGGDPVGGPAAPVFGRGVVDVKVEISAPKKKRRKVLAMPVGAHTWYWHRVGNGSEHQDKDCIEQLRKAMNLHWS